MSTNDCAEVPLVEQLRSVPKDWREMREVGPCHHRNVPYGVMIHEAADTINALRLALAASRDEAEKVKADSARLDWLEGHVHHTHLDAAQESCYLIQHWDEKSARAAIDAARADAARKEQT